FMIVTPADTRNLDKVLKLIGKTPEEVTLDLDWASAKTEPRLAAANKRSRERTRDEGRGRGRPASETSVASMEPIRGGDETESVAEVETAAPAQPPRE